jgi:hypothetical protein
MAKPPHTDGGREHLYRFLGGWNYPHAGGTRPPVLFQTYHNFVLPHASLCQPIPVAEATNGGSARVWRPCPPAMAAGLTDYMWSLKEVLFYRVPPWPQVR